MKKNELEECSHLNMKDVGISSEGLGHIVVYWCPDCEGLKRNMTNWKYTDYPWEMPKGINSEIEDYVRKDASKENVNVSTKNVLKEIKEERTKQDEKWGGPSHDDGHPTSEFCRCIKNYAGWVDQLADSGRTDEARANMLKVAALAVASIESMDRKAKEVKNRVEAVVQ